MPPFIMLVQLAQIILPAGTDSGAFLIVAETLWGDLREADRVRQRCNGRKPDCSDLRQQHEKESPQSAITHPSIISQTTCLSALHSYHFLC